MDILTVYEKLSKDKKTQFIDSIKRLNIEVTKTATGCYTMDVDNYIKLINNEDRIAEEKYRIVEEQRIIEEKSRINEEQRIFNKNAKKIERERRFIENTLLFKEKARNLKKKRINEEKIKELYKKQQQEQQQQQQQKIKNRIKEVKLKIDKDIENEMNNLVSKIRKYLNKSKKEIIKEVVKEVVKAKNEVVKNEKEITKDKPSKRSKKKKQYKKNKKNKDIKIYEDVENRLKTLNTSKIKAEETFSFKIINRKKFLDILSRTMIKEENRSLFVRIDGVIFPLNSNNFELIKQKIIHGDSFKISAKQGITESDSQMIERLFTYDEITVIIYPKINKRKNNEGAFFPYLVKDLILYNESWKNYGIYNKVNLDETNENCFITSLYQYRKYCKTNKQEPIITLELIETLKHKCSNRVITIKTIKEICEDNNMCISINPCDNGNHIATHGERKNIKRLIKLGKIKDHFFHIDNIDTGCTSFYLSNLDDIRKSGMIENKSKTITRKRRNTFISFKPNLCTSLKLIKFLVNNETKYLNPISLSDEGIAESNFRDKFNKIDKLEYDECLIQDSISKNRIIAMLYKIKKEIIQIEEEVLNKFIHDNPKLNLDIESLSDIIFAYHDKHILRNNVIFFDVETTIDGKHKVYIICSCQINEQGQIYNEKSFTSIDLFLQSIPKGSTCYAHNLGYDISFLVPYLTISGTPIAIGKKVMSLTAMYYVKAIKKNRVISFKDSYPLISMPLSSFPSAFNLPQIEKEVINYKAYTKQSIKERYVTIAEFCKDLSEDKKQKCIQNIIKWKIETKLKDISKEKSLDNILFNHIEYSRKYCEIDVKILAQGVHKFSTYIDELCSDFKLPRINIHNMISIPSIVNLIFDYAGCYDDVVKVSGHVREFIARAVVGGKTMSNNNKKWRVIGDKNKNIGIEDLDKVSLYPSAMARFEGFVKGKPNILKEKSTYEDISKYSSYIVEIRITTDLPYKLDFPILSYVDNNGIRNFSNNVKNRIYTVGKTMLEDVIKFHKVDPKKIEIIRGYYYNQGYNTEIKTLIVKLFNKRLELKKAHNPMQMLIKLVMNSGYGKLIQKPIADELRIIRNTDEKAMKYISKNHNKIKYYEVNTYNQFFIKLIKNGGCFNYTTQGVDVLDMSKRIMNEIMCLAQELKIKIIYLDTDGMHIETGENRCKIIELASVYLDRYKIELLGDNFDQFNTDFAEVKGKGRKEGSEPKSYELIVLGKKSYIDNVSYIHVEKGEDKEVNYIHNRMKGIPKQCFPKEADEIMNMYRELFDGKEKTFDLAVAKTMFERTRTWEYSISEDFKRKVIYKGKGETIYLK